MENSTLAQVLNFGQQQIEIIECLGVRYWSANDLYIAGGATKQMAKFWKSEQYEALLEGAKECYAIIKKGNFSDGSRQGTWIHKELVGYFLRWLGTEQSGKLFAHLVEKGELDYSAAFGPQLSKKSKNASDKVYFISDGEYIKIGVSTNLEKRIKSLQVGNPRELKIVHLLELTCSSFTLEKQIHTLFERHHKRGEWFTLDVLNEKSQSQLKDFLLKLTLESAKKVVSGGLPRKTKYGTII